MARTWCSDDAGAVSGDDVHILDHEVLRQARLWLASNLWFT